MIFCENSNDECMHVRKLVPEAQRPKCSEPLLYIQPRYLKVHRIPSPRPVRDVSFVLFPRRGLVFCSTRKHKYMKVDTARAVKRSFKTKHPVGNHSKAI
jgi:hypothetical protein